MRDKESLNSLFSSLVDKRNKIATNTGFKSFRDYKFAEMGRFDYKPEDCFQFHQAVKEKVMPLVNEIYERKKKRLGIDTLRPWDLSSCRSLYGWRYVVRQWAECRCYDTQIHWEYLSGTWCMRAYLVLYLKKPLNEMRIMRYMRIMNDAVLKNSSIVSLLYSPKDRQSDFGHNHTYLG